MEILSVEKLTVEYPVRSAFMRRVVGKVHAVRDVSFAVKAGETLAVVGESGSGKTTMGRAVARLLPAVAEKLEFEGKDLRSSSGSDLRAIRQRLQIIFQNPYTSLDRGYPVRKIIGEPLKIHKLGTPKEREARVDQIMELVSLRPELGDRYLAHLSGGQRQRVAIARALALHPRLIICDEPVSALDISVQAQILNLLLELKRSMGISLLFITHDLGVVQAIADTVAVMHAGQIVELATKKSLFAGARHPYSKVLLSSIPERLRLESSSGQLKLKGPPPSPLTEAVGCLFAGRCYKAKDVCRSVVPPAKTDDQGNIALCHFADEP